MEGATSDLRSGLSLQMIEIHEPMRLLFLVETSPEAILSLRRRSTDIDRLIRNEWIQIATFGSDTGIHLYHEGEFKPYTGRGADLPVVSSSANWFRGIRDNLSFASIVQNARSTIEPRAKEAIR